MGLKEGIFPFLINVSYLLFDVLVFVDKLIYKKCPKIAPTLYKCLDSSKLWPYSKYLVHFQYLTIWRPSDRLPNLSGAAHPSIWVTDLLQLFLELHCSSYAAPWYDEVSTALFQQCTSCLVTHAPEHPNNALWDCPSWGRGLVVFYQPAVQCQYESTLPLHHLTYHGVMGWAPPPATTNTLQRATIDFSFVLFNKKTPVVIVLNEWL